MIDRAPVVARKRILPPTYLLCAVVAMTVLHLLLPWKHVASWPATALGTLPLVGGVVLNLLADAALKKHATTVKPFEESSSLATTGVYRVSRHPMYLGFVLILCGLAVLLGSASPFVVVVGFIALLEVVFIRVEERMLKEKFGDEWRAYTARVRRWA